MGIAVKNRMVSMALIEKEARKIYKQYYKATHRDGALDLKTKELVAISVSAVTGCQGCLKGHLKKAIHLGITVEQIREAIAIATAVAAATVIDSTDIANQELGLVTDDLGE